MEKSECSMHCKIKKTMNMYQELHLRANVDGLYVPGKGGGKVLLSVEENVSIESRALEQYLKENGEDEWLKIAWGEDLAKED